MKEDTTETRQGTEVLIEGDVEMNAIADLSEWVVRGLDTPFGWLLLLPRDAALLIFSALTALLMTLARRWVTNQDLLHRCADDLRQLKQLLRIAKQSRDKPSIQRLRRTQALIKGMQLGADLKLLSVVLLPFAALAIWATERLDYFPLCVGEDFVVRAEYPRSSIDSLTHLVPMPGFELKSPAIQVVRPDTETPTVGLAQWTLRPTAVSDELVVTIRHHGESVEHRVAVGRWTYLPPQELHANEWLSRTEVLLARYRPLSLDLRTETIGLPPWMVGYLGLTLLLVPAMKRWLRVF